MALVGQKLDVPLTGGVDEKTRAEIVQPGSLLTAENLRQIKSGTFQKAFGCAAISSSALAGGNIPACKRIIPYKDELVQTDGLNVYSRIPGTVGAFKKATGYAPQLLATLTSIAPVQLALFSHDIALVNGFLVITYTLGNSTRATDSTQWGAFVMVMDQAGNVVLPPAPVSGVMLTGYPQVAITSAGNVAILCYGQNTSRTIVAKTLDTSSAVTLAAGWSVATNLVTDMNNVLALFDVCALGSTFAIAYVNLRAETALTSQISVRTFNSALAQQAINTTIVTGVGAGFVPAIAIHGTSAELFVAYGKDTTFILQCAALDGTTLTLTGTTGDLSTASASAIEFISVLRTAAGAGIAVANTNALGAFRSGIARRFNVTAGAVVPTSTQAVAVMNLSNYSKLFLANGGRAYCSFQGTNTDFQQLFTADMTATMNDADASSAVGFVRIVANVNPRLVNNPLAQVPLSNRRLSGVVAVSATKSIALSSSIKNALGSSLDLITFDWASPVVAQPASIQETVVLGGSPPSYYDGVRVAEVGFFQRPVIGSITTGGGAIPAGSYKWIAVYEQMDDRGQWHQSNVSDPFTLAPGAPFAATVNVSTLTCTNRADIGNVALTTQLIRAALYRTSVGGSVFKRVPGAEVTLAGGFAGVAYVAMVDGTIDALLGAVLYTQPGIPGVAQVKVTPPPFSCMIAHNDRIVGACGKVAWFSGQTVYGEGPWFADAFQFPIETGGDITAMASMDGAWIIFKRNAICYVDGQGPPDNGIGSDFSPPQFIATDVGCIDQRSVVVTPAGVMFQSLRGIELLTRGRHVASYMGRAVEAELAAFPVCTSAVLEEASGRVVFTLVVSEGSASGTSVEFDLVHQMWTTHPRLAGVGIRSAAMVGSNTGTVPVYMFLTNAGATYQESAAAQYLDDGVFVSGTLETPWIHVAGLNGFQRVRRVMMQFAATTPANITMSLAFDYAASYTESATFGYAAIAGWAFPQFELQVGQQKCQAIRIKIVDTSPGGDQIGNGVGPTIIGISLEIAVKPTFARIPIAQGM